jgi:hypothetical protein
MQTVACGLYKMSFEYEMSVHFCGENRINKKADWEKIESEIKPELQDSSEPGRVSGVGCKI